MSFSAARPIILFYLANILCCVFLLLPAFYNGYGIVNSDFGTYLPSGFKSAMPVDRPITYGILLRIFSLNGLSLWPVLFVQAFFVSNLIIRIVRNVLPGKRYLLISACIIAFLSIFTGLSWTVSQLQPDIYTPIALLCLAILLIAKEDKFTTRLTLALYLVSIATHVSHMVMFVLMLLCLLLFLRKALFPEKKKMVLWLLTFSILPTFSMLPVYAKSKHIFLMGSLNDKGILKQYLDERCPTKQYRLCSYKDNLPKGADNLIWESDSPVYKEGGWAAVKPEYDAITSDIFGTPHYVRAFVRQSLSFTCRQLVTFNIGAGNIAFTGETYVCQNMLLYLPHEYDSFMHARQNKNSLLESTGLPNAVFGGVLLFTLFAAVLLTLMLYRRLGKSIAAFLFICAAGILINAWDCATFSNVNDRYGCKMIWLIPFCTALLLLSGLKRRKA